MTAEAPVLAVQNLTVAYGQGSKATVAVRAVDLQVARGEVLGLVGESGCGKTTTGLALLRLLRPPAQVRSGRVLFEGQDLLALSERQMEGLRGNRLSLIFQNPMTSLNPTYTIGAQISESICAHRGVSKAEARDRVVELLRLVHMPAPERRLHTYPHELSGGQRQRAMIALAIALEPRLVIADEPTTALDLTIQAQILWLLGDLKARLGMAMIYITHDLHVAAGFCDRIAVIYAGEVVELADAAAIMTNPQHPYTRGLVGSLPETHWRERMVESIRGQPPVLGTRLEHCPFAPRCPEVIDRCRQVHPALTPLGTQRLVRCIRRQEGDALHGAG
jgi:peptide/nickel transport system ATP-binding protein